MSKETKSDWTNKIEYHLGDTDLLLQAVLDVAEVGRQEAKGKESNGRFIVIQELLGQYRESHTRFIESLYRPKEGKAA